VTQSGTALRFRLSAGQMSVIWPGLDLLIKSYIAQNTKGGRRYEYPFRMFPPPFGFYRGVFSQEHMDQILALKCARSAQAHI